MLSSHVTPETYQSLEPAALWDVFARISAVPRPSEGEERVRRVLESIAGERGWVTAVDGAGNLVVHVPATRGREGAAPVILQAHMDMVCIKREGAPHDFDRDPIALRVEQYDGRTVVTAQDTTLGADNGIGVAAAMAAAMSPDIAHGPLELLLTTNEETGMTGAKGLDAALLRGKRMINLDTEEDDAVYNACVGGGKIMLSWQESGEPARKDLEYVALFVDGLRGGHSGLEIHQNRGNAIQILAGTLARLPRESFRLACLDGGDRHNAIPAKAAAVVAGAPGLWQELALAAMQAREKAATRLGANARDLTILAEPLAGPPPPVLIPAAPSREIVEAIAALPHGALRRDVQDPSIVETSCNVAIVQTRETDGEISIELEISTRSLIQRRIEDLHAEYASHAARHGARFRGEYKYPPWEPNPDSALLVKARRVYARLFGQQPRVASIHGGLECAIIGSKIPGIDMISIGPLIEGAHTPSERVHVQSVQKFWRLLASLLDELSRG